MTSDARLMREVRDAFDAIAGGQVVALALDADGDPIIGPVDPGDPEVEAATWVELTEDTGQVVSAAVAAVTEMWRREGTTELDLVARLLDAGHDPAAVAAAVRRAEHETTVIDGMVYHSKDSVYKITDAVTGPA